MAYFDTSILGACYCPEPLSGAANAAMAAEPQIVISPLVEVEFCSVLSLKVRRGVMDRAEAGAALGRFQAHLAEGLYRVVETGPSAFELARNWLARCDTALRTLDALHLATAFIHGQELLTADKLLNQAAQQIGVKCRLLR